MTQDIAHIHSDIESFAFRTSRQRTPLHASGLSKLFAFCRSTVWLRALKTQRTMLSTVLRASKRTFSTSPPESARAWGILCKTRGTCMAQHPHCSLLERPSKVSKHTYLEPVSCSTGAKRSWSVSSRKDWLLQLAISTQRRVARAVLTSSYTPGSRSQKRHTKYSIPIMMATTLFPAPASRKPKCTLRINSISPYQQPNPTPPH